MKKPIKLIALRTAHIKIKNSETPIWNFIIRTFFEVAKFLNSCSHGKAQRNYLIEGQENVLIINSS